jgi:hypothetical protein
MKVSLQGFDLRALLSVEIRYIHLILGAKLRIKNLTLSKDFS